MRSYGANSVWTNSDIRSLILLHAQVFSTAFNLLQHKTNETFSRNKCCRQKQNHSHTFSINIFKHLFSLGSRWQLVRFNMLSGQVTFSRHYTATFVLGIHLFLFKFYRQVRFLARWKSFLLVSYFYFWAKPFSFWAKRCGRNSLWAKLTCQVACHRLIIKMMEYI